MIDRLRALFGPAIRVVSSPLIYTEADLLPEERALCARAVEKRKREVAAGRVLARRALAELGIAEAPLMRNADRSPQWPAGVVGSISHSNLSCVVAVARAEAIELIGVDVEERTPLDPALYPMVLVPNEARWLAAQPAPERGELAKLIFSAKECVYKAQYIRTKKMLDFKDVEMELDRATQTFEASVLPGVRGFWIADRAELVSGIFLAR